MVETTPNLLDTALYEVSNTSSSHLLSSNVQFLYPLRPVTSLINFIHLDYLNKVVIPSRDTFSSTYRALSRSKLSRSNGSIIFSYGLY